MIITMIYACMESYQLSQLAQAANKNTSIIIKNGGMVSTKKPEYVCRFCQTLFLINLQKTKACRK